MRKVMMSAVEAVDAVDERPGPAHSSEMMTPLRGAALAVLGLGMVAGAQVQPELSD